MQRVALEGLRHVVEGAGVHRLDGGVDAAEGGHQHDGRVRVAARGSRPSNSMPVRPGMRMSESTTSQSKSARRSIASAALAADAGLDALVVEQRHDHLPHCGVVIDHENGARSECHASIPKARSVPPREGAGRRAGSQIGRT